MNRERAVRAVVQRFGNHPFQYGSFDCCELVRQTHYFLRGKDPAPHLQYEDELGANIIIDAHGGLSGLMTTLFGESVNVEATETADPVLIVMPAFGDIMGIRVPNGALVPLKAGLHKVPIKYAVEGWRI